jgi:hypothetical protein
MARTSETALSLQDALRFRIRLDFVCRVRSVLSAAITQPCRRSSLRLFYTVLVSGLQLVQQFRAAAAFVRQIHAMTRSEASGHDRGD